MDIFIKALEERAKELNCLYRIEELLNDQELSIPEIASGVLEAIPPGWQYPDFCHARLVINNEEFTNEVFFETPWVQRAEIAVQDTPVGYLEVYYTEEMPDADEGPFLKEERKLINTIADRISHFILHQNLKKVFHEWQTKKDQLEGRPRPEWSVILDMLHSTDPHLFSIISRKMANNLFCRGILESTELFKKMGNIDDMATITEINRPSKKNLRENTYDLGREIFETASDYLSDSEMLSLIQKWIHEEKSHFLVKALANLNTPLTEIADAIRRYYHINPGPQEQSSPVGKGIRVALIRRFLTDQLQYINIAKNYSSVSDFYDLLQKMIFPAESHGKLGGKSAGLFLAKKILEKNPENAELLAGVKTPKTWYITSDGTINFIYYNNLEDVVEQKYKPIDEIRQEYPHIIQAFKNSNFPPEIINGLSRALDDFGDKPIIVRSSSLLEDRMGSAFAGKYKSLFLANQGTKEQRLEELTDAIAEVYASTFGPDPVGYRIERGLLDFHEEMGIMIQEVVGKKVGKYYLPAFAGVAFSNNEFRWSPRIRREDGLIRMVPGLGTRAVDRVADDYPILIAPGQPDLRVNLTFLEQVNYSPKYVDVINLETNTFETIHLDKLVKEVGNHFPMINDVFSIREETHLRKPVGLGIDTKKHDVIPTFENLISNTRFVDQVHVILRDLRETLDSPVDIEFACDGDNLYLLQCRPQSSTSENISAIIPKDIDPDKVLFSASRFVSNGKVPDVHYIVYIDPEAYAAMDDLDDLKQVGKVVGRLNKMLPKKSFILMGPGRWGSRDDIRLGVRVTYSDINNTSMLIEIARQKGNYIPDLSFGTHFFQDLVEASIRYLPLYPDDEATIFNYDFFRNSENILTRFLPKSGNLEHVVKVINVPEAMNGQMLRILMNADDDEAVAIFTNPQSKVVYTGSIPMRNAPQSEEPAEWRTRIAESIAASVDPDEFGVKGIYLYGTTMNRSAGPNSDIDLLVHYTGEESRRHRLEMWLRGWNNCLEEINYQKYGIRKENIIDPYFITDEELKSQRYYAGLIKPDSKSSRKLKLTKNGSK
ncbi:MAG: PEP/pyruvate-binding domain-containing protein [Candidatus Kapaibacterium sp.]